jgi:hypothetical protein
VSRLTQARIPGSVDEARTMVAYNERILATSQSQQRRARATAMLANVRPHLERLEREEQARLARVEASAPPAHTLDGQIQRRVRDRDEHYEVVWSGDRKRESLTGSWDSKPKVGAAV